MGFWEKSVRVFKCLCENGQQGERRIAQQTGLSKSSVHRLTQAIKRRDVHPESWLWETADGRQWLIRLIVATLYTFGLPPSKPFDPEVRTFIEGWFDFNIWCKTTTGFSWTMQVTLKDKDGNKE